MGRGVTPNIDQIRRKLRDTEKRLLTAEAKLKSSKREITDLRKENDGLKKRMHRAAATLLPDGTTLSDNWDNYQEPGY